LLVLFFNAAFYFGFLAQLLIYLFIIISSK